MKSIILAAGQGTRLLPLTKNTPKSLVNINGVNILETQLNLYKKNNIKSYVVCGYLSKKIKKITSKIFVNKNFSTTNMVYTLFKARSQFDDDIIISYGDIIFTEKTLKAIINSKEEITVAVDQNWKNYWSKRFENPLDDLETLVIDKKKLIEIGRKPKDYSKIHGQYIGLIKISKNILPTIIDIYNSCSNKGLINNKPYKNAYMTDFIQELINRSFKVNVLKVNDPWVEVDTLEDYNNIETTNRINQIIELNNGKS